MGTTEKKIPLHVVMRTGAIHFEKIEGNLVEEHNGIAKQQGYVYLGKAGRRMGETKIHRVRNSIQELAASRFIVVFRERTKYKGFYAPLLDLQLHTDFTPDKKYYPKYYKNIIHDITMWFKIGVFEPVPSKKLESYLLALNNNPLLDTLRNCRTSLLLVH